MNPGTELGPYKILAPLGKGGMGEVYRAKDTRLGREVAIKVLPEHLSNQPELLKRFEREAKSLAALSHLNILTIYDVGSQQGISYVVTELLEGEPLRAMMARGPLHWEEALKIAIPVAEGLAAAHSKGVIHRDLKPENIFLTKDGHIKVLDFGLARWTEEVAADLTEAPTGSSFFTESGAILGTPAYMSPEQVRGMKVDGRTDIFSFGCVLFEMISGNRPFVGKTATEIAASILKDPLPKISVRGVPDELERIVKHCLGKDLEDRFQSASDVAFDLKALLGRKESQMAISARRFSPFIAIMLLVLLGVFAVYLFESTRKGFDSLAVIPFVNASSDSNMEYLSDGITESLMNNFAQLPKVRVMSRSSVFRYKGKEVDPQKVGRELNVQAVLTGRIEQRGEDLFISAELVDARNNRHLWGEQYNRRVSDLLAVQSEISQQISENLRFQLTGEEQAKLTKHYTQNTDAYQLYLKGRFYWNKRSKESTRKGIEYFEQAIRMDPNFGLAYSGLSDCYRQLEDFPRAKAMAIKALQIDDSLAEAHTSLGRFKVNFDWDWAGAEAEFRRAIQLNPNYTESHHAYSHLLNAMGRIQESLVQSNEALVLAPVDVAMNAHMAWHYMMVRQYDRAVLEARKAIELDPTFFIAQFYLGQLLVRKGSYAEAIPQFQKAIPIDPESSSEAVAEMAYAYGASGKIAEAKQIIQEWSNPAKTIHFSPYETAVAHLGTGDRKAALDWLEKAYQQHETYLIYLKVEPIWDPVRTDPKFQDILKRMKFPA